MKCFLFIYSFHQIHIINVIINVRVFDIMFIKYFINKINVYSLNGLYFISIKFIKFISIYQ